jgi:hypothetical protein
MTSKSPNDNPNSKINENKPNKAHTHKPQGMEALRQKRKENKDLKELVTKLKGMKQSNLKKLEKYKRDFETRGTTSNASEARLKLLLNQNKVRNITSRRGE